jgi:hypothetical protein
MPTALYLRLPCSPKCSSNPPNRGQILSAGQRPRMGTLPIANTDARVAPSPLRVRTQRSSQLVESIGISVQIVSDKPA